MSLFEDRKVTKSSKHLSTGREGTGSKKSGVYFTSEMQGILAIKENNESKAANLVSEYLSSLASTTYDEAAIKSSLDKMLIGFTTEEKLRIVSAALVRTLCKIS